MAVQKYFDPDPVKLLISKASAAFVKVAKPEARKNKDGTPKGDPKYQLTWLLDASNVANQAVIKLVKDEGKRLLDARFGVEWPKRVNKPGFFLPFGKGNDLTTVYAGFENMWYLKSNEKTKPVILGLGGRAVIESDEDYPRGTDIVSGRIRLFTYDNESAGLGCNLLSVQTIKVGPRNIGRAGGASAEEEARALAAEADVAAAGSAQAPERDPFDDDIPF